jgi:hypothetical protein
LFVATNAITQQQWIRSARHAFESSANGDELKILDCQNPGNTHGGTAILVIIIVVPFPKFPLLHLNILGEASNSLQSVQFYQKRIVDAYTMTSICHMFNLAL